MVARKVGIYPSEVSLGAALLGRLLHLTTNIMQGLKCLPGTHTLAYEENRQLRLPKLCKIGPRLVYFLQVRQESLNLSGVHSR